MEPSFTLQNEVQNVVKPTTSSIPPPPPLPSSGFKSDDKQKEKETRLQKKHEARAKLRAGKLILSKLLLFKVVIDVIICLILQYIKVL